MEKNFHGVSEDLNNRFQRHSYQGCFLMARKARGQVDGGERWIMVLNVDCGVDVFGEIITSFR